MRKLVVLATPKLMATATIPMDTCILLLETSHDKMHMPLDTSLDTSLAKSLDTSINTLMDTVDTSVYASLLDTLSLWTLQ